MSIARRPIIAANALRRRPGSVLAFAGPSPGLWSLIGGRGLRGFASSASSDAVGSSGRPRRPASLEGFETDSDADHHGGDRQQQLRRQPRRPPSRAESDDADEMAAQAPLETGFSDGEVSDRPGFRPRRLDNPFPPNSFGHQLYSTRNRSMGLAKPAKEGFPQTRDEAYRIQLQVEKSWGDIRPKGWRLSHTSAAHRLVAGVSAPILHPVHHCHVSLADKQRVVHPRHGHTVFYPEAVFQLGEDLPLRVVDDVLFPYSVHEVAACVSSYGPGASLERYHLGLTPEVLGPVREHTLIADSCGCRYTLRSHIRHSPPMLTSLMSQGLVSVLSRKQTRYSAEISQAMGNPLTALTYLVNEIQRLNFQHVRDTGRPEPFYALKADQYLSVALCGPQPVLSPVYTLLFDHFFRPADVLEVRFRLDALPHAQALKRDEQRRRSRSRSEAEGLQQA